MKNIKVLLAASTLILFPFTFFLNSSVSADLISNPINYQATSWSWPASPSGYTEMDTLITPLSDGSPDGYTFASTYSFNEDNSSKAYLGLQTEGSQPSGKLATFTVWVASQSNGSDNNFVDNNGTSYTSSIVYPWQVNSTYDLKIALTSQSSGNNIWTASVTNTSTGTQSTIGFIGVPVSKGSLYDNSTTFQNRYSGSSDCANMVFSEVKFTGLSANNGSVVPSNHQNSSPVSSFCSSSYSLTDINGGVESSVGNKSSAVSQTTVGTSVTSHINTQSKASSKINNQPTKTTSANGSSGLSDDSDDVGYSAPVIPGVPQIVNPGGGKGISIKTIAYYSGAILLIPLLIFAAISVRRFINYRYEYNPEVFDIESINKTVSKFFDEIKNQKKVMDIILPKKL